MSFFVQTRPAILCPAIHWIHTAWWLIKQQHLFNNHFSGQPGVSRCQNATILDFIGAVDDGGGVDNWSRKTCKAPVKVSPPAKQCTTYYRLDALPVAQPTVSQHWKEKVSYSMNLLTPSSPGGLPSLFWPLKTHGYHGEGCQASLQHNLKPQTSNPYLRNMNLKNVFTQLQFHGWRWCIFFIRTLAQLKPLITTSLEQQKLNQKQPVNDKKITQYINTVTRNTDN